MKEGQESYDVKPTKIPMILTLVGLLVWFIPVIGGPIALAIWAVCFYMFRQRDDKSSKLFATISCVLALIELLLIGLCAFSIILFLTVFCLCLIGSCCVCLFLIGALIIIIIIILTQTVFKTS